MARAQENPVRTFTKEVDGETKTRRVYSAADEVAAKFEGFTEQAPEKAPAKATGSGNTGTNAAK